MMVAHWSLVPAICDRLVALFTVAMDSTVLAQLPPATDGTAAQVVIIDGPPVGDLPDNYVTVGYSGAFAGSAFTGTTGLAVEATWGQSTTGNRIPYESPEVQCEASTFSGDSDLASMSRQRVRTRALLDACAGAVAADPTLGGLVTGPGYAALIRARWLFDQADTGASVTVQFSVGIVGESWLP
jgi:hypothetical protein